MGQFPARVMRYARYYRLGGLPDPTADPRFVRAFQGIGRTIGHDCPNRKDAVMLEELRAMRARALDKHTIAGLQDWTVLSVGFFGALRRSELVALDIPDLTFGDDDIYVQIRRSKTEQFRAVDVPLLRRQDELCPVSALQTWLRTLPEQRGPVFRTTRRGELRDTRMADQRFAGSYNATANRSGSTRANLARTRYAPATSPTKSIEVRPICMLRCRRATAISIRSYATIGRASFAAT